MSLRFTDPRKWQQPWFRKMMPEDKLAFFYVWECCDNAGFIPYDDEAVAFHTGIAVNRLPKLWAKLADRLVIKTDWMWLVDFPRLQKNWPLNPRNKCHTQIIRLLSERYEHFKDIPVFTTFMALAQGLDCPLGKGNGFGNGMGEGFSFSRGQGNGHGKGNEIEEINQELQECAAEQSGSIHNPKEAEEEYSFLN